MRFNTGQVITGIVLGFALICLGIIGYTYATNAQARAEFAKNWQAANEDRHVCRVVSKHVNPADTFASTHYLVSLDCGNNDDQGTRRIAAHYFDDSANDAHIYAGLRVGTTYVFNIDYVKGGGYLIRHVAPTTLPIGHEFNQDQQ